MFDIFKNNMKKFFTYLMAILGALGIALQNYMAIVALPASLTNAAGAVSNAVMGALQGIGVAFGGVCSGITNLFINIGLIESFLERITGKKSRPELTGFKWFSYWFGSGIFICTGILFGLTCVAFGPAGPLAALGIAAGIFVAGIMTIQELETWLQRFDDPEINKKVSIKQAFIEWKNSLTKGKVIGLLIAIGNVIALSLLFTMGLATVLTGVGVPALPALIVGFTVAFTAGAFTEFYFYHGFLSRFCDKFKEKWAEFKKSKWPVLGAICASVNAVVNTVLVYVGITMIAGLLVAAGVAAPPLGAIMAVAAITAICAGIASFILGIDFWTNNIAKISNFINKFKKNKPAEDIEQAWEGSTLTLSKTLKNDEVKPLQQDWEATAAPVQKISLKRPRREAFWNQPKDQFEVEVTPVKSLELSLA